MEKQAVWIITFMMAGGFGLMTVHGSDESPPGAPSPVAVTGGRPPWEMVENRHLLFYKPFPQASTWRTLPAGDAGSWKENAGENFQKLSDEVAGYHGKGTGFYRTVSHRGRWWLLNPDGRLFLSAGINGVNAVSAQAGFKSRFRDEAHWAEHALGRLKEWGFNTAGQGSDVERVRQAPAGLAYTVTRWPAWEKEVGPLTAFGQSKGQASSRADSRRGESVMPVFHPEFEVFLKEHATSLKWYAGDRNLLGYLLDSHLPFPELRSYLESSHRELHRGAREAAVAWLESRGKTPQSRTAEDEDQWAGHVYAQYCSKVVAAIRAADPGHLVLGPPLSSRAMQSPAVLKAVGRFCDVVSLSPHGKPVPASTDLDQWSRHAQKPVLIAQLSAELNSPSSRLQDQSQDWIVPSQFQKGRYYETFVLECLKSRVCVGWHWQQYQDQVQVAGGGDRGLRSRAVPSPPAATAGGGNGLVAQTFQPHLECVERMKLTNSAMYAIAASGLPPARRGAWVLWTALAALTLFFGVACKARGWGQGRTSNRSDKAFR